MYFDYNVYVACGLTNAPQEFRGQIEDLKTEIRRFCRVLCFLGCGTTATPRQVFEYDIGCVFKSHLIVAVCDFASTGMGIEIGGQILARKMPLMAVAQRSRDEAKQITDMIRDTGLSDYHLYDDLLVDVPKLVRVKLAEMQRLERAGTLFESAAEFLPADTASHPAVLSEPATLVTV